MKYKHLTKEERDYIKVGLDNRKSFKQIGKDIGKDCTTIAKEVRSHYKITNTGCYGKNFNDCIHRNSCTFRNKTNKCNSNNCEQYQKYECSKLKKAPYVCNGCPNRNSCTLTKQIYDSTYANEEYEEIKKESREGVNYSEEELQRVDEILKPLICDKGQSIHHAVESNKDSIMISEREIYKLIDMGFLSIKNIDLPRKVRYRKRKRKSYYKVDKKCTINRKYDDFTNYIKENPDTAYVEMDSVEGVKGGKVLLTLHFVKAEFMIAFIRDHNNSQSVIDIFNYIESLIGLDNFRKLFPVILTDNGSEFSNPLKIEFNDKNEERTKIFYCEPGRSDQKGSCEVNHELIRRIIPQGESFDNLTQEDISLMMSHINSYKRKKLNNCCPLQLFNLMYGNDIASTLGNKEINANDITLNKSIFNR